MSAKLVLIFCAQAILVQSAFSQCAAGLGSARGLAGAGYGAGLGGSGCGGYGGYGAGIGSYGGYGAGIGSYGGYGAGIGSYDGYGAGVGSCGGVASTGGGLPVTSVSPTAPIGISVQSDNAFEGTLCASGNLPFLGTVVIEGEQPTAGAGAVSYGCGNGATAIAAEEGSIGTGILGAGPFPPAGPTGYAGYGSGISGCGGYGFGGIGNGFGGLGNGCGCGVF